MPRSPHVHFGANADRPPDPTPRAYQIDVRLEAVPEAVAVLVMHEIADVLASKGLAVRSENEKIPAAMALTPHPWAGTFEATFDLDTALHVIVPKLPPTPPSIGLEYSPN